MLGDHRREHNLLAEEHRIIRRSVRHFAMQSMRSGRALRRLTRLPQATCILQMAPRHRVRAAKQSAVWGRRVAQFVVTCNEMAGLRDVLVTCRRKITERAARCFRG